MPKTLLMAGVERDPPTSHDPVLLLDRVGLDEIALT